MNEQPIHRRNSPRISIEALCFETLDKRDVSGIAVDLSSNGLCLERPYAGGRTIKCVPLQIEIPGLDEVLWARGEPCFDTLIPDSTPRGGPLGLIRRTGYEIVAAAARDLRLLKEYVFDVYWMGAHANVMGSHA